jgi:PmbA protein
MKPMREYVKDTLNAGASDVQVKRISTSSRYVYFESNTLKTLKSDHDTNISVKAFAGNKTAAASSNDEAAVDDSIAEAITLARVSKEDDALCLPEPEPVEVVEGLYDDYQPDLATCLSAARILVETARGYDPRVMVDSCIVQANRTNYEIASSRGIDVSEKATYARFVLMGMARDNDQVSSFNHVYMVDVAWRKIHEMIVPAAEKFSRMLIESLGARAAPKGRGFALFSPDTVGEILWTLSSLTNARNVQEQASRFKDKVGRQVMADIVTIRDCPRIPGAFTSTAFDGEGVPTRELPIVENGVLATYLYDSYSAKKDGTHSTGHSLGGTGIGLHAPRIGSTESLVEMRKKIDKGIFVKRYSGDMDPMNGVVSGVVKGGRYVENGCDTFPVTDTLINTDLFDLYMNITAVSEETELTPWGPQPYILVKDVNIIGK